MLINRNKILYKTADRDSSSTSCCLSLGKYFKENLRLLDYGCGHARFCNFMCQKLQNFEYYGVEPNTKHGQECIEIARKIFEQDKRVHLGYIGEELEKEAIDRVDVALLISVFTHLAIEQTEEILFKLFPIVERGGAICFTIIHGKQYEKVKSGEYGLIDSYRIVYNTEEQIEKLSEKLNCKIELKNKWYHKKDWLHSIYLLTRI